MKEDPLLQAGRKKFEENMTYSNAFTGVAVLIRIGCNVTVRCLEILGSAQNTSSRESN